MHIILVLGRRLLRSGKLEDKFVDAIRKGVKLKLRYQNEGLLVISGGATRPGFCSEARAALPYMPQGLGPPEALLEERAKSTRQNVQNVRDLLAGMEFDSIHVVGIPGHVARARELFKEQWPEALSRFHPEHAGTESFWDALAEQVLRIPMKLDPQEKYLLPLREFLIRWKIC